MAQNYTRQSTLSDGDTITASLFNDEYNQLVNAFTYSSTSASSTGHRHDGSSGQGGNIFKIGDLDFLNKIEVDSTNNRLGFYVEVSSAAVEQIRIQDGSIVPVTTNDIDLGTSSLQFKDLYIDGTANVDSLTLTSGSTVTTILDEDDLSSDSATALVTQQSVKAYVDAQVTAQDLDFQADSGGALSIDLDSEALTFTGGTGVDTSGSGNSVTFAIDSTVATLTGTQTLTNKTLTSPDVNTPDIDGGTIDGTVIGGATPAAVSATTVSATGNITVGGTVDGRDVATDGTKLDGIEASATADQTAAEIRTLVESASDSNVFTDADHSKLNAIEASATADQTDAEIRAAVEAATDSNVFTDADHTKLNAIEASADVTDTANVTAAGALMDSELTSIASVKALNQGVATGDSPTFVDVTATSLDISGNIDVDGTTNLDVVDIDGAVDMASTLAVGGVVTANAGVVVDNITIDGQEIDVSSGNLTLDVAGETVIDSSSSGILRLKVSGTDYGMFFHDNTQMYVQSNISDGDMVFRGKDGGSTITALTLDMSAAGAATFNSTVTSTGLTVNASGGRQYINSGHLRLSDGYNIEWGGGTNFLRGNNSTGAMSLTATGDLTLDVAGDIILDTGGDDIKFKVGGTDFGSIAYSNSNLLLTSAVSNGDILFKGNDGGSTITALTLNMSEAGEATFNSDILLGDGKVARFGTDQDFRIGFDGSTATLHNVTSDSDILFKGNDGGSTITALTLDMSAAGAATFNAGVTATGLEVEAATPVIEIDSTTSANLATLQFTTSGTVDSKITHQASTGVMTIDSGRNSSWGGKIDFVTDTDTRMRIDSSGTLNLGTTLNVFGGADRYGYNFYANGQSNQSIDGTSDAVVQYINRENADGPFTKFYKDRVEVGSIGVANGDLNINGDTGIRFQDTSIMPRRAGSDVDATVDIGLSSHRWKDLYLSGVAYIAGTTGRGLKISNATESYTNNIAVLDAQHSQGILQFKTAGTERFRIAADGSLSTPTLGTSNVRFGVNAGNSIASGGNYNVVVGDEAGTAITTGDENVAVGFEALKAEDATKGATAIGYRALLQQNLGSDGYNVAVGHSAGISNTTGTSNTFIGGFSAGSSTVTGGDNTAVGRNSLFALTSGVQNTIVGSNAGDALTTGSENVAIGMLALTAEDTGRKNVAIGTQALLTQNADIDNYNTAVGYFAGKSVTTGVENTLIGGLAGDALTDSDRNVAVGFAALGAEIVGQYSTAIGWNSLGSQSNSSAANALNTAVGYNSGAAVTTGVQNTLIGGLAGDALTDADYNTALGYNALTSDTLGSYSTAIGRNALYSQNFTSATASHNTAIGYAAGEAITTGTRDTLIGSGAGDALTTGSFNVAVGYTSLGSTTTGSSNVAVGDASLNLNTTGSTNTAVGQAALSSNTTADNNTAVGYAAGTAVTTGTKNTFMGGLAGDATTTGFENIAIGYDSLGTNTLGSHSVAVGPSALRTQNYGSATNAYNTAVGSFAGYAITTGIQNTFIGGLAGDALTDADNNVALGYSAMTTNVLGSESVAIGTFALNSQNPASATNMYNVAVGHNSGASITTGTNNTFVGGLAGDGTDDGVGNTAVGKSALSGNCGDGNTAVGNNAGAVITGGQNTVIGVDAGDSLAGGSNNVCIGAGSDTATTTASNTVTLGNSNIAALRCQVQSISSLSDERDKTEIIDSPYGLEFINSVRPVQFKWQSREGIVADGSTRVGFIAQELLTASGSNNDVLQLVSTENPEKLEASYSNLLPIAIKAIQEQQALIDALTARIETLEG